MRPFKRRRFGVLPPPNHADMEEPYIEEPSLFFDTLREKAIEKIVGFLSDYRRDELWSRNI